MLKVTTRSSILWAFLLVALLFITFSLYQQGLRSPFIFDDIPNLSPMGQRQYLGFWHDVGLFLLQGDSGPTGRPLSLLSFYLNDTTWTGASAANFKYTNVMLHLLNGALIFWLAIKLLEHTSSHSQHQQYAIALLSCALWLLHPIQINTVLYVVQRMTELSALFTLLGLLCYLQGRERFLNSPWIAWLWLVLGCGLSLILSVLSKETGILLFVYILVIEYTVLRPFTKSNIQLSYNIILILFVWLPFLVLIIYLFKIGLNSNNYSARSFDVTQRLMSEARVIWDYVNSILLPNPGKSTLFHDDFIASNSWLDPITTLPAILGVIGLFIVALLLRYKQPIISFALLWFLGGHLLESTTIPLELYFEHRNYLPLFGIVFALAWYGLSVSISWRKARAIVLSVFTIVVVAVTQHGVLQWTNPAQMVAGWLQDHPQSQRTIETLDAIIGEHISDSTRQGLLEELNRVGKQSNTSSYLIFRNLLQECKKSQLSPNQLDESANSLQAASFVNASPKVFADLVNQWKVNRCGQLSADNMLGFINKLKMTPSLSDRDMQHALYYWQAEIQVNQGNLDGTLQSLDTAYKLRPELDTRLLEASYLSSAGLYKEAQEKLATVEKDLCQSWRSCMNIRLRQADIESFRELLKKQLKQKKEASINDHSVNYSAR